MKIGQEVAEKQLIKPTLVIRDESGNTLWMKWIKTRQNVQIFAKNNEGRIVNEEGVTKLMKDAGYFNKTKLWSIKPVSEKGKRIMERAKQKGWGI